MFTIGDRTPKVFILNSLHEGIHIWLFYCRIKFSHRNNVFTTGGWRMFILDFEGVHIWMFNCRSQFSDRNNVFTIGGWRMSTIDWTGFMKVLTFGYFPVEICLSE